MQKIVYTLTTWVDVSIVTGLMELIRQIAGPIVRNVRQSVDGSQMLTLEKDISCRRLLSSTPRASLPLPAESEDSASIRSGGASSVVESAKVNDHNFELGQYILRPRCYAPIRVLVWRFRLMCTASGDGDHLTVLIGYTKWSALRMVLIFTYHNLYMCAT